MSFFKKLLGQRDDDGESDDFKAFLEGSMEGLRIQTQAHDETWGIGRADQWDFSQDTGELLFTFPDKLARAPAQIIGSLDTLAGTWMWAWANSSIAAPLVRDAAEVRKYGVKHGIRRLTTPVWPAEEMDGWQMSAIANRLCESNGVYRGPADSTFVFFTFGKVELRRHG